MKLYHITCDEWPEETILQPRTPERGVGCGEPDTPRICVCPSLVGCILACGPDFAWFAKYIYQAVEPFSVAQPCDVFDSEITQELWITTPTKFVRVSHLNLRKLPNFLTLRAEQIAKAKPIVEDWLAEHMGS